MNSSPRIFFSEYFGVDREVLDAYGAFDINLLADVRLFVDPFLLFNSTKPDYSALHSGIIEYLKFLKSIAGDDLSPASVRYLFRFQEVRQNWFGYCELGNDGHGLGEDFARAMREALGRALKNFGEEGVTKGSHLEKVALIRPNVGKDNISDFTTNLIKHFLVEYTERFARDHLSSEVCRNIAVPRVRFNYDTETWVDEVHYLPVFASDYVLLTPTDILIHDDVWINHRDMVDRYPEIVAGVEDQIQRARINRYFEQQLSLHRKPSKKDSDAVRARTFREFPELLDEYIRVREDTGEGAAAVSEEQVAALRSMFVDALGELRDAIWALPGMSERPAVLSIEEVRERVGIFKRWVEDQDGYKLLNRVGGESAPEADVQHAMFLAMQASLFDVNREANNGRGPVDFAVSLGSGDKTLLEIKLGSNSGLKKNLQAQLAVYEQAHGTKQSVTMIVFYTEPQQERVARILKDLGLEEGPNLVLVNARNDDKPSGSKAKPLA